MDERYPSFEQFLTAPTTEIAHLSPKTMIFAAGGTRRSAVLAGITPTGNKFAQRSFHQMITCFDLFFKHGVRHIITHAIIPSQYKEITVGYREKLLEWVDRILAGPEALAIYQHRGWGVRLIDTDNLIELESTAKRLLEASTPPNAPKVWVTVTPDETAPWKSLLAAVHRSRATTQADAIRAQFGEDIPPATLYIGSGKPGVFPAVVPPLLMGKMQCYWTQRPGYIIEQVSIRAILYDFAYTRSTWQKDKAGRAEQILLHREVWEQAPILGLGVRLGPFWYPASISPLPDHVEQE